MKHDTASSLILARPPEAGKLRGLLPLEFNMHAAGIPACRQAGRQKNPLGYYIPPLFRAELSEIHEIYGLAPESEDATGRGFSG
jgi:hypothetical protein